MAQKLTIEFKPKGDKALISAIKQMDIATKQLQGQTSIYKNELKKLGVQQKKYNRTGLLGVRNLRNTTKATSKLIPAFSVLRSKLLLISFATLLVSRAFKTMFEATIKQEKAEKKLEASLGKVNSALLHHASALQEVTEFGDEAIIEVQALIGAFTKDEEQIKSLTEATLDLAAAKGMDLKAAADLVAKSFGSSTNSLSRYGVEVVGVVGSTKRLESLTTNIAELFGGQATAQTKTLGGAVEQMKNAFGDANEELGKLFTPTIINATARLKKLAESAQDVFFELDADPMERTIRNMEKMGMDASDLKKQWLEVKKAKLSEELVGISGIMEDIGKLKEKGVLEFSDDATDVEKLSSVLVHLYGKRKDALVSVGKEQKIIVAQGGDLAELEDQANTRTFTFFQRTRIWFDELAGLEEGSFEQNVKKEHSIKEQAEGTLKNVVLAEELAKQYGLNAETIQLLVDKLLEIEGISQTIVNLGEDQEEGGFFAKLFGKFSEPDEMGAMAENVQMWSSAVLDIGNSYMKLQQMQMNQAKQEELDAVKGIRNEKLRQKETDKINKKYEKEQAKLNKKTKQLKRAQTVINTSVGIMEVFADENLKFPANLIMAAFVAAQGAMQLSIIDSQKYQYGGSVGGKRHSQGGTMIEAEQGEYVVSRSGVESVGLETLNRINAGAGGGGGASIIINNPILGKDTIEDEIVPQIKEALRRGGDIGV